MSGMAFGIDAAAHRAAPSGVAVSPCGLDRTHPSAHAELVAMMLDAGGVILSRYPPGSPATRTQFLARNQLIAALSDGVVVVEASLRSTSLDTAHQAREPGRAVMAVPGPITSVVSSGGNAMIRTQQATAVMSAADVVATMGW